MPRSYSFDHFTAVQPDPSKIGTTNDAQHPVKSETPLPEQEGLHYGRQHAETVMRAQARQMERETEQLLEESSAERDEAVEPPSTPEAQQDVVQRPRRRTATKRASTQRKPAKRAAAKREHHTSVAQRSERKPKATGSRKKTATRPARKAARGTKSIAGTTAVARTVRRGRKPAAKKTTRGTARRPTKKR
jgi:hypothetical protein